MRTVFSPCGHVRRKRHPHIPRRAHRPVGVFDAHRWPPEAFRPPLCWGWYFWRAALVRRAAPNAGHPRSRPTPMPARGCRRHPERRRPHERAGATWFTPRQPVRLAPHHRATGIAWIRSSSLDAVPADGAREAPRPACAAAARSAPAWSGSARRCRKTRQRACECVRCALLVVGTRPGPPGRLASAAGARMRRTGGGDQPGGQRRERGRARADPDAGRDRHPRPAGAPGLRLRPGPAPGRDRRPGRRRARCPRTGARCPR